MAVKDILKKCPFCGEAETLGMARMKMDMNDHWAYFIRCIRCEACGPWSVEKDERDPWDSELNTFSYTSPAMKIAMDKWNERKMKR